MCSYSEIQILRRRWFSMTSRGGGSFANGVIEKTPYPFISILELMASAKCSGSKPLRKRTPSECQP